MAKTLKKKQKKTVIYKLVIKPQICLSLRWNIIILCSRFTVRKFPIGHFSRLNKIFVIGWEQDPFQLPKWVKKNAGVKTSKLSIACYTYYCIII